MSLKVRVTSNSSRPVEVMGLGLLEPNTWVEVTPEQERAFENYHGTDLESSDLETQSGAPHVAATSFDVATPVGDEVETPETPVDDEGGEE